MANVSNILDDIITKLSTISVAGGYNNTPTYVGKIVKDIYEISDFPQIAVMVGDSEIKPDDSIATVFRENLTIHIVGYVNANTDIGELGTLTTQGEGLIADIKKAMSGFVTTNINSASSGYLGSKYFIDIHNTGIKVLRVFDDKSNVGVVSVSFNVVSYSNDNNFN